MPRSGLRSRPRFIPVIRLDAPAAAAAAAGAQFHRPDELANRLFDVAKTTRTQLSGIARGGGWSSTLLGHNDVGHIATRAGGRSMTADHQPREDRETEPELDKETLKDLEPEQHEAGQVVGASNGGCAQDKI
jgi:hypothetical protein